VAEGTVVESSETLTHRAVRAAVVWSPGAVSQGRAVALVAWVLLTTQVHRAVVGLRLVVRLDLVAV